MKTKAVTFNSLLTEAIVDYLAYKRALKRRYDTEEASLRLLDRYLVQQHVASTAQITPELIASFLQSRPRHRPRSYNHLLGILRCFFAWLTQQGILPESPVTAPARRSTKHELPFLFDSPLARRLLELAAALPDNSRAQLRGPTYHMIFALLYALGLRVGEVARLCWQDVDIERQLLEIRHAKFDKSRLVPFGPRLATRLLEYRQRTEQIGRHSGPQAPLFSFTRDRAICTGAISMTFHQLVSGLVVHVPPGVRPPCAHSLRHSFAVSTLRRWYEAGIDPGQRLIHLSTFMGHVAPSSTAVYLTITKDLLQQANQRFQRLAAPVSEGATP